MADLKITQLPALAGVDLSATDVVPVADISASETKKITVSDLVGVGVTLVSANTIPGAKLVNDSVTATQIAANAIGASELADDAVDTAAIAASAVTDAKIASGISGSKLTNDTVTAAKISSGSLDRGLNKSSGSIGHSNSVTAGARSGITFDAQGHITATSALISSDLPAATSSTIGGVSIPAGSGLSVSGVGALTHSAAVAGSTRSGITYDNNGHITATTALVAADLPNATTTTKGAVSVPAGDLSITSGSLTHNTSGASAGTYTKVTVNTNGHVTAGTTLIAADIPSLAASKITSGTFDIALLGTNSITGVKLANNSTVRIGGATSTSGIVTFPTPDFTGQQFFDANNGDLYLYDGNTWQPITVISGNLVYGGTYNAATNTVRSVTTQGSAIGLTIGSALPAASSTNLSYYVVVSDSGTGVAPAPVTALAPPDMLVSSGTTWDHVDVSNAIAGQTAGNISLIPYGNIAANNVQTGIQELDDEKLAKAGGTVTGELLIGTAGSFAFEGTTANAAETFLTVVDPTADRTITLPDASGTVTLSGAIVNADINASAAIVDTKLATISTAGKVSNSATTAVSTNTASAIVARDGSGNFSAGTITAALTGAASSNVLKAGDTMTGALTLSGAPTIDLHAATKLYTDTADALKAPLAGPTFTGVVSIAAGTAALPSLAISGDPNTGIYSPGADQVAISSSGQGRLYIVADGNIGVGVSNPATPLQIASSGTSAAIVAAFDATASRAYYQVGGTTSGYYAQVGVDTSTTFINDYFGTGIAFQLNASEKMRLTSTGLGVGVSGPQAKLEVAYTSTNPSLSTNTGAGLALAGNSTVQLNFGTNPASPYNAWIQARDSGTNSAFPIALNPLGGNVGIGTSSPGELLDLAGGSVRLNGTNGIYKANTDGFNYLSGGTSVALGGVLIAFGQSHATNPNEIHFRNSGNQTRAVIDSSGRLGIGTTAPSAKLEVAGGNIRLDNNQGVEWGGVNNFIYGNESTDFIAIATNGNERSRWDSSGRLLVGTSSSSSNSSIVCQANSGSSLGGGVIRLCNGQAVLGDGEDLGYVMFGDSGHTAAAEVKASRDGGTWSGSSKPTRLVFSTTADGAASPTERMRIDSTGLMTLAGPGIKFPATQVASADPNTLDDYEEGTWTPTQGAGLTVVGTFTSAGHYIKIGRQVTIQGYISASTSVSAAANAAMCGGLPFQVMNVSGSNFIGGASNANLSALINVWANQGSTVLYSVTSMAVTGGIYFTVSYFTA
jgi:hypothetical protein